MVSTTQRHVDSRAGEGDIGVIFSKSGQIKNTISFWSSIRHKITHLIHHFKKFPFSVPTTATF